MPTVKQLSRKIEQELNRLSKAITIKLERFYKQNVAGSTSPVETVRQNDKQIKGIIRDTVQSSWIFSHTIIADVIADRIDLTTKDITGIESLTKNFEDQFWTTSHKLLTRETEFKVTNGQLEELTPFDIHAAFIGIGGLFAYYAFNYSMQSKTSEINRPIKLKFVVREDCTDNVICLPLNGQLFDPGLAPNPPQDTHRHCHCKLIPTLA